MSEISELRRLLNINLDRSKELNKQAEGLINQIEELKKEDEVKPVFPVGGAKYHGYELTDDAHKYGLTADDLSGSQRIKQWLEARAYVIEAINKANGGLNGFLYGKDNYFYIYRHQTESIDWLLENTNQHSESHLICRNLKLIDSEEFKAAYKTMLGIK